jgi:hypothetical protein
MDTSVQGTITDLEKYIYEQSLTKDKETCRSEPELKRNMQHAILFCGLHWLSRMLVLYLCLLKNPKLSQVEWLRYQLKDGRVRILSLFLSLLGFILVAFLFLCLQDLIYQVQRCLRPFLSQDKIVNLRSLLERSLQTVGVAKKDIFAAVDEADDIFTHRSRSFFTRDYSKKGAILSAFLRSARGPDVIDMPVVFLGTSVQLTVYCFPT